MKQLLAVALLFLIGATPAHAQWTRVPEVPVTNVISVSAKGDTVLAGTFDALYISTDAGATWRKSRGPGGAFAIVQTARVRNHRLFVGTAGLGVFVSDDLGFSWQPFNEGLVGGFLDTQLDVSDLEFRGDSLVAGTFGAGVWVRSLAGVNTWHPFGAEFEPNQASNVLDIAVGGSRLVASAGGNGSIFWRDPGDADWTISWLNNVGLHPGIQAMEAAFNGHGWVVGTLQGVTHSVAGEEPWTLVDPGFGTAIQHTAFAVHGRTIFASFNIVPNTVVIDSSADDGASWEVMDVLEQTFVFRMAMVRNLLYAARADGLWRRTDGGIVDVPGDGAPGAAGLAFSIVGPQPVGDQVRFAFELPEPADASLALYDVRGRRVAGLAAQAWSAGAHQLELDMSALRPGVYQALLVAGARHATKRVVRNGSR